MKVVSFPSPSHSETDRLTGCNALSDIPPTQGAAGTATSDGPAPEPEAPSICNLATPCPNCWPASYATLAAGFIPRRPSSVAPSRFNSNGPFCLLRSRTCCLAAAATVAECWP
jgi:hypothetical protein